jgi:hypothetical protein
MNRHARRAAKATKATAPVPPEKPPEERIRGEGALRVILAHQRLRTAQEAARVEQTKFTLLLEQIAITNAEGGKYVIKDISIDDERDEVVVLRTLVKPAEPVAPEAPKPAEPVAPEAPKPAEPVAPEAPKPVEPEPAKAPERRLSPEHPQNDNADIPALENP